MINPELKKRLLIGSFAAVFLFILWEFYIPNSLGNRPTIEYEVQKGQGLKNISADLKKQGIIKSYGFFNLYALISGNRDKLQAGSYDLSSSMSIAQIVKKFASGDIIKNNITIIEGWNLKDIAQYLEAKKLFSGKDFLNSANQDLSAEYSFLKDKPKKLSLEGYIFPDTYEVPKGATPDYVVKSALDNFDKKLTPDLRKEIANQHKSIFEIITMASILEKEVKSLDDKKVVSGILWKRIDNNMGLSVDSTINYITGKNDTSVSVKDTKINSLYNTYKYVGLPLGPISNPGMDSILAAIYPTKSDYWYYLSDPKTGNTIFSKTLDEHNEAVAKYLK